MKRTVRSYFVFFLPYVMPLSLVYGSNVDRVRVIYYQNGSTVVGEFSPSSSNTIHRDAGTSVNLQIVARSVANQEFFYADFNNARSGTAPKFGSSHVFEDAIGAQDTQVWAGIDDNTDRVEIFILNLASGDPDLIVNNVTVNNLTTPGTYEVGQEVEIENIVWNIGEQEADSSRLAYYISNGPNRTDHYIDDDFVRSLGEDEGSSERENYTFRPQDVGTQKYFVLEADYEDEVTEGNENNNFTSFGPFTVLAPPPLLTLEIQPDTAITREPGESFEYQIVVTSEGDPVANAVVAISDELNLASASVTTNAAGQAVYQASVPSATAPGTYLMTFGPASKNGYESSGTVQTGIQVDVSMMPFPILLVHGLASDHVTWENGGNPSDPPGTANRKLNFVNEFIAAGYRPGGNIQVYGSLNTTGGQAFGDVFTMDFSDNQNLTFAEQGQQLGAAIQKIRQLRGGGACPTNERVILVGHSMGGLAARAFLQFQDTDGSEVAALVTIGTPHHGAEIADILDPEIWLLQGVNLDYIATEYGHLDLNSVAVQALKPSQILSADISDLVVYPFPAQTELFSIAVGSFPQRHLIGLAYLAALGNLGTLRTPCFFRFFETLAVLHASISHLGEINTDGIVPEYSQSFLNFSNLEPYGNGTTLAQPLFHTLQTSDESVFDIVRGFVDVRQNLGCNWVVACPDPEVTFSTGTLEFGQVELGNCSGAQTLTLRNLSSCESVEGSMVLDNNTQLTIISGGDFNIPPGGTHTVSIQACPLEGSGQVTETVGVVGLHGMPQFHGTFEILCHPPTIQTQPQSAMPCLGSMHTFQVVGDGTGVSYQWQKDGVNLPGETGPSLQIDIVTAVDQGNYACVLTSSCGSLTSQVASLNPSIQVSLSQEPEHQMICRDQAAVFEVVASGYPDPTYQWFKDQVPIPGANQSTYALNQVTTTDAGIYFCRVSHPCNTVDSKGAELSIMEGLQITRQPDRASLCAGDDVTLQVEAMGSPPITYQWQKDGVPLDGATNPQLQLTSVSALEEGVYTCVMTNPCETQMSQPAMIDFVDSITVLEHPIGGDFCEGDGIDLRVIASGESPLSYQWQKDGQDLAGQTSPVLSIPHITTQDEGVYRCRLEDSCSGVYTNPGVIEMLMPPSLVGHPQNQEICPGDLAVFSAVAVGTNLTYQWFKDDLELVGETESSLVIEKVMRFDEGLYHCEVQNQCGLVLSEPAELTVDGPLSVELQPPSMAQGLDLLTFQAIVDCGLEPIQWDWLVEPIAEFETQANHLTFTEYPLTSVQVSVVATDLSESSQSSAIILVAQNPEFFDYNDDQCNNLLDLWQLAEFWLQPFVGDPNGDGLIDVRDLLYINTEDPVPCP